MLVLCHPIDKLHEHLCENGRGEEDRLNIQTVVNVQDIKRSGFIGALREKIKPLLLSYRLLAKQLKDDGAHKIPLVLKLEGTLVLHKRTWKRIQIVRECIHKKQ